MNLSEKLKKKSKESFAHIFLIKNLNDRNIICNGQLGILNPWYNYAVLE